MLNNHSIFLPSSPPNHRMARLAMSALYGKILIVSVRRIRISIPCFCASVLSFLIRPATIYRYFRHIFLLFDTVIPKPYSTVVISSIGTPVSFSSFSFIYLRQNSSLHHRGGSWCIHNFSSFTALPDLRWASTITHPSEPLHRYNRIHAQSSVNRDVPQMGI